MDLISGYGEENDDDDVKNVNRDMVTDVMVAYKTMCVSNRRLKFRYMFV